MVQVLDFQGKNSNNFSTEIVNVLETTGYVYLLNVPELPYSEAEKAFSVARKFWELETETKKKYRAQKTSHNYGTFGYFGVGAETIDPSCSTPDIHECFHVNLHSSEIRVYPDAEVPEFRPVMQGFFSKCHVAAMNIMKAIATGLGLNEDFFMKSHQFVGSGANATALELLRYPPLADADVGSGATRCGAHVDYGTLTLLFQDSVGGLEALSSDGQWIPVDPEPGALLLQAGHFLEIWTSGRIKAINHRVSIPSDPERWLIPRYSMGFFLQSDDDYVVSAINGSNSYSPTTSKQYLIQKFSETC